MQFVTVAEVYQDPGRVGPALSSYRATLAADPGLAGSRSSYRMALNYEPGSMPEVILAEHHRWEKPPLHGTVWAAPPGNRPEPNRLLRIGYVSPDCRAIHPRI